MPSSGWTDLIFGTLRQTILWAAHVTLAVMVGALFAQVVSRYFSLPLNFTEELARFSFIAMVFVGASYASQNHAHLRVTVFADAASRLGAPVRWTVERAQTLAILAFDCLFCFYASRNLIEGFRYPMTSPALGFNENIIYLAPVIGFAAAIVHRVLSMFVIAPAPAILVQDGSAS